VVCELDESASRDRARTLLPRDGPVQPGRRGCLALIATRMDQMEWTTFSIPVLGSHVDFLAQKMAISVYPLWRFEDAVRR